MVLDHIQILHLVIQSLDTLPYKYLTTYVTEN